ncbi:ketopantoate reductase family protein [Streptomyces sp. RY43-2]|uniref:Ketopantoate reductase family protein n=1 Tax=Streptomyces macrolidinus TaxID=2952607 RepID=A0ABT0ZG66_9ACTN|nr:2-dehydropantoate 2-reductase N-terminal domain-containing protein [Streptomyces macrolidinus]MCN9242583.1 ketopantoate reductase family protein [Streptomyces macrolidinus]
MRYIVIGAGAVGGSIGGRLHESSRDVVLVARGAHGAALREDGLRFTTPEGTRQVRVPVAGGPEDVELRPDDVLVLAVKTQHTADALTRWAGRPVAGGGTAGESLPLVCAQNGVENERLALRLFRRVYGVCVVLPASFLRPGAVTAACGPYTGVLVLGRYPDGTDDTARRIAADLEDSVFRAPVVPDVMRFKYAKLLGNLAQTVEALCGPVTPGSPAAELAERARAEGTAVLKAAGIDCADTAELAALREGAVEARPMPEGERALGSTWQSLARGAGSVEVDYLNGEFLLLGRMHGVPTPVNETLLRLANASAAQGREPGATAAVDILALLRAVP